MTDKQKGCCSRCGARDSEFAPLDRGAAFLCCSRGEIYKKAKRGEIELVRLGGRTLVRWSELDRVAASAETWAPPPRAERVAVQSPK